jgi:hypothetical protein
VGDLRPVVKVAALAVLDPRQDLPLCSAIAAQLIGDDYAGHILQTPQELAEASLGSSGIAAALHENSEHLAVLVYRPPNLVPLASNADENLVEVPFVA